MATFVPKPHTPYQWSPQLSEPDLSARHEILQQGLRYKSTRLSWENPETSLLEAALSRGDRRTGQAIYKAWKLGCRFDAWSEYFRYESWVKAFKDSGLEPGFYAYRGRSVDEILPWSHIDTGVSGDFLKAEFQRSADGLTTPDCRVDNCNACGLEGLEICSNKL